ncbi:MAG: Galactokinase [Actinomycetia bacterium]|nr:Galactokinase [Actinomycetes bacterium]
MTTAWAPGRVNIIGDHTDHTGGWCLPAALGLGTTVTGEPGGDVVVLTSDAVPGAAVVPIDIEDPATVEPGWARYVAGVVAELRPAQGFTGTITSDLPIGAGLSSSASLQLAVALALGAGDDPLALARLGQRAEHRASGVPCGILDQLASAAGVAGHALLLDCTTLAVDPVPVPPAIELVVVPSGEQRTLVGSAYAERRAACEAAERLVGPLRHATDDDVAAITDPVLRRRARHVVTENRRVGLAVDALRAADGRRLGTLLVESHRSLAHDFEVSTPTLDALVARLLAVPGVHGARLTGAGFGGCVVAVTEPGTLAEGWVVRPSAGAHRVCAS